MSDFLGNAYPKLALSLRKLSFASLPTPVSRRGVETAAGTRHIAIKHDELTSNVYGGNKVRKLEYILRRAKDRGAARVATFGAVGSNHALATAMHARELGLECTCFLAHQKKTPRIPGTLRAHLELGTEIVKWGTGVDRLALYRRYLQGRKTWVIPLGGTCWLGALGFVNAGLELAAQIDARELETPDRIYIANGTMGSVAGLAIGLALAELPTKIHAVRVADNRFVRRDVLDRLMHKTAGLLRRFDPSIPPGLVRPERIVWRGGFFAGGYAAVDDATAAAVDTAKNRLGLELETTYTGKAMAALLHDLQRDETDESCLFWNTYGARPLPPGGQYALDEKLPESFERYFE